MAGLCALALCVGCDGGNGGSTKESATARLVVRASGGAAPGVEARAATARARLEARKWTPEAAPTPDGGPLPEEPPNPATVPWPVAGELAVTELLARPAETTAGARAWLELVSRAAAPRRLDGCELVDGAGAGSVIAAAAPLEPDEYALLTTDGESDDGLPAPDGVLHGDARLETASGLTLRCGGAEVLTLPPAATADMGGREPGVAMQRDAASPWVLVDGVDSGAAWCDALESYGPGGRGTPGEPNLPCDADVDWCRLVHPAFVTATAGTAFEAHVQVSEPGLTDAAGALPAEFVCQVGLGPDGADPSDGGFEWTTASEDPAPPPGLASPRLSLRALVVPSTPGVADIAARCTKTGGVVWLSCDLDGSQNGYQTAKAGHALVQAP
ncbi:MAG: hypothetical protein H6744_08460 [Deltaproteobacteria bacterium]|nr:hypothetical protein [Deltaproteobacteria bacterium]